ncbi:hypothetical protein K7432_008008 [Basidiobolus ranarum]|uniref:Enoyl reductase (ER) domain-containing protein n=1 Tax=Basidiobolus ranarum TaxID=34480 RepID=A0ABR2VZ89_9FUNG
MKALFFDKYTTFDNYTFGDLPNPEIHNPTEVLIKVHAASINPIDYKRANGLLKMVETIEFPGKLGYDVSGEVVAVGSEVERFKIGDLVYGRVQSHQVGTLAEYCVASEFTLSKKLETMSHVEAASYPLVFLTALQALITAGLDAENVANNKDKKVFITSGLGGVGYHAVLLAKNFFKVTTIATTVSTGKLKRARETFGEDTVLIDYKTQEITKELHDYDVLFDTVGTDLLSNMHVLKRGSGCVSIASTPTGTALINAFQSPDASSGLGSWAVKNLVNLVASPYCLQAWRLGINYEYIFMKPNGSQLENILNLLFSEGNMPANIDKVYGWSEKECKEAYKHLVDGHSSGKVVIKVRD